MLKQSHENTKFNMIQQCGGIHKERRNYFNVLEGIITIPKTLKTKVSIISKTTHHWSQKSFPIFFPCFVRIFYA